MKWWKKALILSGLWLALTVGVGVFHTEVLLKGKTTPAQDEAISEAYGMACGFGVAMIWFLSAFFKKKPRAD
jgi:hypothetical protein